LRHPVAKAGSLRRISGMQMDEGARTIPLHRRLSRVIRLTKEKLRPQAGIVPTIPSRTQKPPPRLCGQIWMIRRFTSARLFLRSTGAKQKNHSGSGHYGALGLAQRFIQSQRIFAEGAKR
jgi:hypothetical protein